MSELTDFLYSAYAMTDSDLAQLELTLFQQMRDTWLEQLSALARQHGNTTAVPTLTGAELARLQQKAHDDAVSIVTTYNRELDNEIERMCADNPDGDADYYIGILDTWGSNRNEHKSMTVSIGAVMGTVYYAFRAFMEHNQAVLEDSFFRCEGASPVCPACIELVGMGVVDYQTTLDWQLPLHVNCSHEWVVVRPSSFEPTDEVWLG